MSLLARIVLTWLLAFALPVQGVVAATMQGCAPDHHGPTAATAPDHVHSHGDTHAHDAPAPAADVACSVCAACCASAAIAPSPLTLDLVPATPRYAPASEASPVQRAPDRLERPPRPLLA